MRFACAVSSRTFFVKPVRRSPLNAVCQLLCRSPLAVAPVLRNFAARGRSFPCARFVELRRPSGSWRLEAGPGWVGLKSKLLMSFALEKSTS